MLLTRSLSPNACICCAHKAIWQQMEDGRCAYMGHDMPVMGLRGQGQLPEPQKHRSPLSKIVTYFNAFSVEQT